MKDKEYMELVELKKVDNGFIPINERAMDLLLTSKEWETLSFSIATQRDLSFHKCYFKLINFIYYLLPIHFQKEIPREHFYNFLKCLTGQAKIVYEFKTLPPLVEYESISFSKMNQVKFKDFVREQLSIMYAELFPKLECENIIDNVESRFEVFLKELEV